MKKIKTRKSILIAITALFMINCGGDSTSSTSPTPTATTEEQDVTSEVEETTDTSNTTKKDITDKIFTNKSANCKDYVLSYSSAVSDLQEGTDFEGELVISLGNGKCTFSSNIIPNHNFNQSGRFAEPVQAQAQSSVEITTSPAFSQSVTALAMDDNAIFLNGVKLNIRSAGCYGVGDGSIGCFNENQPFRYDPLGATGHFGADEHNAHTQPGGVYHYHGSPLAMYDNSGGVVSPVIGFARDGFPIFGPYFNDNGTIRKAISGYQLKSGTRQAVSFQGKMYNPQGQYDGTYVDDWEHNSNKGDLDECNGMTVDGVYGYYAVDTFPWVMNCYKGTPDSSFGRKRR